MSPPVQSPYVIFIQCDVQYLKFLQQYLKAGISFLQSIPASRPSQSEQYSAEKQLIQSLILLEKMLMHIYLRNNWLNRDWYHYMNTELQEEMNKTRNLLIKMESVINEHEFTDSMHKSQMKKTLEYLRNYFSNSRIKIIIERTEPLKPWLQPFCSIKHFT
mgnify:CR=1 FL=1